MKLILQVIKALFRKIEASRTHWDTRRIVAKEYTFDGNINGKETIQIDEYTILIKIADTFPEVSSITSLSIVYTSIPEGLVNEYELSLIDDVRIEGGIYLFDDVAFYTPSGGEFKGVHIPSGLYFEYLIDNKYTSKLSVTYNDGELKKLDKKYLPDEVIESIDIANNAQTTANNAQTTANDAIYVANQAQTAANNAQTTANSKMNANNPVGTGSFSMGRKANSVVGNYSHAEGDHTTASGYGSHAEGYNTTASSYGSHAEGYDTTASGSRSHAEGDHTAASGNYSHAEGDNTIASGYSSHAEGSSTTARGSSSHVEGSSTTARGDYSHAEGAKTIASGYSSHAEGDSTDASGENSHAEGFNTTASGANSHAEGYNTSASGKDSHTEGFNTTAKSSYQHVQGICNIADSSNKYAHIVGNGRSISNRSNAHTLDWNGIPWYQGRPQFGGTEMDNGAQTVMANGDKEIILTSSTADSTKKFKITVDDSGTISATEVT